VKYLKALALLLVIVGGVNWLLVGIAQIDLVAAITGDSFGNTNVLSSLIYIIVGIAALTLVPTLFRWITADSSSTPVA
jgi:uncharacterized membrane protein YuzA (DUF378 family)